MKKATDLHKEWNCDPTYREEYNKIMNYETPNGSVPLEPQNQVTVLPHPTQPVLESPDSETKAALVALGQSQPPCEILETIDLGVLPWSKQPIREISPLVWFKYQKEEVVGLVKDAFVIYNIIDGNGRNLFCVNEEGMANFFVNAANVYVHASLTTQV